MAFFPAASIRFRITVSVVAVMLLAIAAMFALADRFISHFVERKSLESLGVVAAAFRDNFDRGMERHLETLNLIAEMAELRGSAPAASLPRTLQHVRARLPHFAWLGWVGADGSVRAESTPAYEGMDLSREAWFQAGLGQAYVGEVRPSGVQRDAAGAGTRKVVDLALPVADAAGRPAGVLAAQLDTEWLKDLVASALDPARFDAGAVEIYLLDKGHHVLAGPEGHAVAPVDDPAYLSATVGSRGRGRFEGMGWIILARQPKEQAYVDHDRLQVLLRLVACALLAGTAGIGLWLSSRLSGPVRSATRDIAASALLPDLRLPSNGLPKDLDELFDALSTLQVRQAQHDADMAKQMAELHGRLRESSGDLLNVNTGLRGAMERLATSEHRLRTIADNLPVLILYLDAQLRLQFCNATVEHWMGHTAERLMGHPVVDELAADLFGGDTGSLRRVLQGERLTFEVECRAHGVTRDLHTICLPDRPADSVVGMFVLCTDVTAMKQVARELERLSGVDALTGLPNRRQLEERARQAIARVSRTGKSLAVLFMDIDEFKSVNDTWGHAAGDEVIRVFGARIAQVLRGSDFVARLAGDEFVAVLEDVESEDEPVTVAKKIAAAVAAPVAVDGAELTVSASIGIALCGDGQATLESLLAAADEALYAAKNAGRNGICVAPV